MIFTEPLPQPDPLRARLRAHYRADETGVVQTLLAQAELPADLQDRIATRARQLVRKVRENRVGQGGIDAFMHAYELSSKEGVVLMCLAEALLRIPDSETANMLIKDKLRDADFSAHLGESDSMFVNASTFRLENSILVLSAVLLGGAGNLGGAILGGFLVVYVPEWLRSVGDVFGLPEKVRIGSQDYDVSATAMRYIFFGIILIVVMIFRPQGLWPNRQRARELKDREKEAMVGA